MTNKNTILITGSEGNLSQWLINNYFGEQFNIIGIDNCSRYGEVNRDRNYKFLNVDLNNKEDLETVFNNNKIDYVFHFAAGIYGVKGFHKFSADILSNNIVSTANLLNLCVFHNIKKVVYISSSMVYESATSFPVKEEDTNIIPTPTTGYGLSKLVGERLLEEFNQQYGLNYVVWRPFNIVTPLEQADSEPGIAHVVPDFIKKIIIDKLPIIEIFGDGSQTRCFTWIDDIAKIIYEKSFDSITDNQIYNVGSEVQTTIIELAKMIYNVSGRTDGFNCKFVDIYNDDVKMRVPDCSKAKSIGWVHSKSIEQLVNICTSNVS